jgi:heptosyltransferase-2
LLAFDRFFDETWLPTPLRLGVFLPNWIGDVVMATPALRALRKYVGPQGRLVGIMRPYVAEVLAGTTWLDEQILCDKPRSRFRLAEPQVYRELRAAKLDQVLLLTGSFRTAWIAWRSGAPQRIGHVGDARAWLLTKRLIPPQAPAGEPPIPAIQNYLSLAEAVGCPREAGRLELATTDADERAADAAWCQLGLPQPSNVVILNSGGAYGTAKHWPVEHFADLARRIVSGSGELLTVVFI